MKWNSAARFIGPFLSSAPLRLRGLALILFSLLQAVLLCGCKPVVPGAQLIGKPLDIQFKAVDGREVNLANLRGKVVLIDFWATWCPPCIKEVPNVKSAYEKLHSRGFEIIGISSDDKKQALLSFVEQNKLEWPQYFEESGGDNKFAQQFGIEEIPTMWLVDKQGKLREIDAVQNLAERVEKLLAEP